MLSWGQRCQVYLFSDQNSPLLWFCFNYPESWCHVLVSEFALLKRRAQHFPIGSRFIQVSSLCNRSLGQKQKRPQITTKGPRFLLYKSSFLPKLKELPERCCCEGYLAVGRSWMIFWAGAVEDWEWSWVQAVCWEMYPPCGTWEGPCHVTQQLCGWAKNEWVTYPTAKDRQWEVSVWYFHTQKSSPKLELQYKIPIQTSPAFCFHWLPSSACTHRAPSFPKENSIADKGHLSRQVITKQVSFCVCIWFLSQC